MSKVITIGSKIATIGSKIAVKTFSIYDLPNLKLWLKADDVVKDGSNYVSQWNDNSGNGFHPIQATGTKQPLWVDNQINGHPVIRFDGNNDYMKVDFGQTFTQPSTIFIVWKMTSSASVFLFDGIHVDYRQGIYFHLGNIKIVPKTVGDAYAKTIPFTDVTTMKYNGASSYIYDNGVQKWTGDGDTDSLTGITLGAFYTGSAYYFNGDIAEFIYYNSQLSTEQRQNVEKYLMSKYNL